MLYISTLMQKKQCCLHCLLMNVFAEKKLMLVKEEIKFLRLQWGRSVFLINYLTVKSACLSPHIKETLPFFSIANVIFSEKAFVLPPFTFTLSASSASL